MSPDQKIVKEERSQDQPADKRSVRNRIQRLKAAGPTRPTIRMGGSRHNPTARGTASRGKTSAKGSPYGQQTRAYPTRCPKVCGATAHIRFSPD